MLTDYFKIPSRENVTGDSSRIPTPTSPVFRDSFQGSPRIRPISSPPLTPSESDPSGARAREGSVKSLNEQVITPETSRSNERKTTAARQPLPHRPASSEQAVRRANSAEEQAGSSKIDPKAHRRSAFGAGGSVPVSRESSPSRSSASNYYSKPMALGGDVNDPYAKARRAPQQQNASKASIDPRFVFSRKKKTGSPNSSKTNLSDKRASNIIASEGEGSHGHHHSGSMADLKRFFRMSGHHHHQNKRESSPGPFKIRNRNTWYSDTSCHPPSNSAAHSFRR